MSWSAVARKDFWDAIRSRLIIGIAGLFVVFIALGAGIGVALGYGGDGVRLIMTLLLSAAGVLVPLIAIGVSYRAIAGERDTGTLKILLSLPNSRADVIIGKFLGRSAVVSVAVLVGFLFGLISFAAAAEGDIQIGTYLGFTFTTLLLGIVFVSIAVSVSAFTASTFRSGIGSFGLFIIFWQLWGWFVFLLRYVANGFEMPGLFEEPPDWAQFVDFLSPITAYNESTAWLFNQLLDQETERIPLEPYGLEGWFGFVVIAVWIALPLAIGYLRFESSDL